MNEIDSLLDSQYLQTDESLLNKLLPNSFIILRFISQAIESKGETTVSEDDNDFSQLSSFFEMLTSLSTSNEDLLKSIDNKILSQSLGVQNQNENVNYLVNEAFQTSVYPIF